MPRPVLGRENKEKIGFLERRRKPFPKSKLSKQYFSFQNVTWYQNGSNVFLSDSAIDLLSWIISVLICCVLSMQKLLNCKKMISFTFYSII
jgi:hypothetical protein